MGCCHPSKTHTISNTIPHPFGVNYNNTSPVNALIPTKVERPSLRHQITKYTKSYCLE